MAVYQIITLDDPLLRTKAVPVRRVDRTIAKLLDNMAETMYDAPGVGLAAPQIGVSKRVIVVDVGDGLVEIINPVMVRGEGTEVALEGCLSVPGIQGEVPRKTMVVVEGLDRNGEFLHLEATGYFARALQHEIDHLEGILFIDRALRLKQIDDTEEEKR